MNLPDLRHLVATTAAEELPALAGQLREAEVLLELRLRTGVVDEDNRAARLSAAPPKSPREQPDRSLDVQEAAHRLGMSTSWIYKNHRRLPFAAKQGRRVVCSARGIERWRAKRMHSLNI